MLRCRQRASQVRRRVAGRPAGGDCVPHNLTAVLVCAVRRIKGAAFLEPSQNLEKLGGGDVGYRALAEPWEYIVLQALDDLVSVRRRPIWGVLLEPLSGDGLEGIFQLRAPLGL